VASPDVTALQRSDLNRFLFADVGTEASGMTLSVVSVLARQGSDPWREAGRLATLPRAEATDSLAHTIADMPTSLWKLPDAVVIAARLIGLLPERPASGLERTVSRGLERTVSRWPASTIAVVLACVAVAIGYAFLTFLK
jgi:hypothetical protein